MIGDLKGKSVLITGAAGCIGAWTVKTLQDGGAHPVVYDLSDNRSRLNMIMDNAKDITWEVGDITDYERLMEVIKAHDIFGIIHLAALQVPFCKADPVGSAKVNVVGTTNIFEAARQSGITRLCYASSIAAPAMGDNDHLATLYGAHKVCGEQMAAVYWQDWQVPSVCIRPGVIYGPGRDQGMSAAPTIAMLAATAGLDYNIPFTGPVAFVHASDAARRFVGAIAKDCEGAHIFDMQGTAATVSEVIAHINASVPGSGITATGNPLPFPHEPDDGALERFINASPYTAMEDGISDTIDMFVSMANNSILTKPDIEVLIEKNS